jgi:hypothetical protein
MNQAVRHFFLRDAKQFPIGCIATERVADRKILYALTVCNPKDFPFFDRARARVTALERLKTYATGGYDRQDPPPMPNESDYTSKLAKWKFRRAKCGNVILQPGQNVKLSLLRTLQADSFLPKAFRVAAQKRIEILVQKAKARSNAGEQNLP